MAEKTNTTESEHRYRFIELDYFAKKLGGIDKLTRSEQQTYLVLGLETGFLTEDDVKEIKRSIRKDKPDAE